MSESGGEQWRPSHRALEGANDYLEIKSGSELGDDDKLAQQQQQLAAQADVKNAEESSGSFVKPRLDPPNYN